jgi:hypothetical protein
VELYKEFGDKGFTVVSSRAIVCAELSCES